MTDDVHKLRETLATLHTELAAVETRDPEVRALLMTTLQQIAAKLQAPDAAAPPTLTPDELAEVARQFEVDHPTVAATLRSVVESLSRMGI